MQQQRQKGKGGARRVASIYIDAANAIKVWNMNHRFTLVCDAVADSVQGIHGHVCGGKYENERPEAHV